MHRLPPNKKSQTKKAAPKTPNIICKFRKYSFGEYLFVEKNVHHNTTNKKFISNKYRSGLLNETKLMYQRTLMGKRKFYFADPNGNLKIKFSDNKNVSYDSFQSFLAALDNKLDNRVIEQQFNRDKECESDKLFDE